MSNGPGSGSFRYGAEAGLLAKNAEKFKATLNTKDAEEFESSRLDLVRRDLYQLQTQQHATKNLMNMKRVQRFLDGMAALQQVLTELGFQEVDSIMACIWGPMRFFFKSTNVNDRAFDDILDVYHRVGLNIPRFTDYRHVFETSQNSIICLVNTYKDVLNFHSTAYKLFSLRSQLWAKLHRATWKDLNTTFDHISSNLQLHRKCIEDHGSFLHRIDSGFDDPWRNNPDRDRPDEFRAYKQAYRDSQKDFKKEEHKRKREQKLKIIKWISALTKNDTLHKTFQSTRSYCPENGEWLWHQHDEVSNWMREDIPGESTIWIHGPRGMGKTILASHVIDRLGDFAKMGHEVPSDAKVCYFYCQEDISEDENYVGESNNNLGILRGILHQLVDLAQVPDDDDDDEAPEQNITNNNLAILPLCEDKITTSGGSTLSNPEVAQSLIEVFFENTSRQYVVIDGLDECKAHSEINQTVNFFTKTVNACEELNQGQLRVMFVSQSSKEIRKCMEKNGLSLDSGGSGGSGEVGLDAKENSEDIRRYVKSKLTSANGDRFNLFEQEKQEIEDKILFMSEGYFLYGHLAVENILKQPNKATLLEKLKPGMLPKGIKDLYTQLLATLRDRLEKNETWDMGKQLLGWLICAHRPLKLHEMDAILSFNPDRDREVIEFDLHKLREGVTDLLGSLVQVLPGDNIRLIHSTAKKYLADTDDFDAESVQCKLATLCLHYLSLRCFVANDYNESERREQIVKGYFSFQDYAMSQWYKHIIKVIESCRSLFDTNGPHFQNPTAAAFQVAVEKFVSSHDNDLRSLPETDPPSELDRKYIDNFKDLDSLYPLLFRLWSHIYAHQKDTTDERNKVGIARLDDTLKGHRAVIEKEFKPDSQTVNKDTMEDYYGPNLFKCSRTLCKFFHHGFNNKKDRDSHQNRHDRPYPCPLESCGFAPVGFSSNKDRQRHVRNYHPELTDGPSQFLVMSRRLETAKFVCNICSKSFTRNINLKGHERSHFGERPYACSHCGKAFARLNDCRRHERIHTRNRQ